MQGEKGKCKKEFTKKALIVWGFSIFKISIMAVEKTDGFYRKYEEEVNFFFFLLTPGRKSCIIQGQKTFSGREL